MEAEGRGVQQETESEAGSEEKQEDKGETGMRAEQKDDNVPIDQNDDGAEPREEGDAGSSLDLSGGTADKPDALTEEDAAASQAVDQFDQMETGLGEDDLEASSEGLPDTDGIPGSGIPMIMLEQWLERIEGDPAYLLRNQFMIEEQQAMERYGRRLVETRPW